MLLVDTLIISEEISYGCVGYSTSCMANELALTPIVLGADEDQSVSSSSHSSTSSSLRRFA